MQGRQAPPEWGELRAARRLVAVDNLRLRRELRRVAGALTEVNIPVLALKGIVLASAAYGDPSLRPMTDLDVLVPPGERENAVRALQKLGFDYPEGLPILLQEWQNGREKARCILIVSVEKADIAPSGMPQAKVACRGGTGVFQLVE